MDFLILSVDFLAMILTFLTLPIANKEDLHHCQNRDVSLVQTDTLVQLENLYQSRNVLGAFWEYLTYNFPLSKNASRIRPSEHQ